MFNDNRVGLIGCVPTRGMGGKLVYLFLGFGSIVGIPATSTSALMGLVIGAAISATSSSTTSTASVGVGIVTRSHLVGLGVL